MTEEVKKYVCFIKRRTGAKFIPYTLEATGEIVVRTLREFLDSELSRWFDPTVFSRIDRDQFIADVNENGVNSKFAAMLGWNYSAAARLVEEEGAVYIVIVHPRFEAKPFSFRRVREEDDYARELAEVIWSIRGGEIVFQEYDPVVHFPGCELRR